MGVRDLVDTNSALHENSTLDSRKRLTACDALPADVLRLLQGRRPQPPFEGFGGMRMRTYTASLPGLPLSPQQVFATWVSKFPAFWPQGNYFVPCAPTLEPGVTAAILLTMPAGMRIITGASVIYMDDTSFTLETLRGHMFAGWITFSAFLENGEMAIRTQALVRPSDPLYELTFLFGFGQKEEDEFWHATLHNAARHFGTDAVVVQHNRTVTRDIQWRYFGNICYNAVIRSFPRFFGRSLKKILNTTGTLKPA
jgi:hypothetical protein